MTFALRWVKENIAFFNGDPNNITLMGQSAGGASVDFLSISPVSRGNYKAEEFELKIQLSDLFHKVIPMAGNASCSWAIHAHPLNACRARAQDIGVNDSMNTIDWVEKLRKLPADKFAAALEVRINLVSIEISCFLVQIGSVDSKEDPELLIGPKYDTVFIPKPIMELRKESPMKPRLVGCAKSEGLVMCCEFSMRDESLTWNFSVWNESKVSTEYSSERSIYPSVGEAVPIEGQRASGGGTGETNWYRNRTYKGAVAASHLRAQGWFIPKHRNSAEHSGRPGNSATDSSLFLFFRLL